MGSVVLSAPDSLKKDLQHFSWVNWSEIAREEVRKKEIFDKYLKTRKVSGEDWKFCEEIDWHPVDELPLKEGYAKKLVKAGKGPFKTAKSAAFWRE
jgi:hypothetical protein